MEKILVIVAPDVGRDDLSKTNLEALSAAQTLAKSLGAPLAVGLIGDAAVCGPQLAGIEGAAFAATVAEPAYSADVAAGVALAKAAEASIVLLPATARLGRAAAGIAARLGGKVDAELASVVAKDGGVEAARWYYRQRIAATFARTERPWVATLGSGIAPAFAASGSAPGFTAVAVEGTVRSKVVGLKTVSGDAQTIRPEAEVLFVAGAGFCKKQADGGTRIKEAEALILDFLNAAQASLGSSKSLVDQSGDGDVISFLTHLHQVGQTGATPRHAKGLAACCHGEEPHTVGWRFVNERRAVNLDAGCGWAQGKADVLYVADAFELMKAVNDLLKG